MGKVATLALSAIAAAGAAALAAGGLMTLLHGAEPMFAALRGGIIAFAVVVARGVAHGLKPAS